MLVPRTPGPADDPDRGQVYRDARHAQKDQGDAWKRWKHFRGLQAPETTLGDGSSGPERTGRVDEKRVDRWPSDLEMRIAGGFLVLRRVGGSTLQSLLAVSPTDGIEGASIRSGGDGCFAGGLGVVYSGFKRSTLPGTNMEVETSL